MDDSITITGSGGVARTVAREDIKAVLALAAAEAVRFGVSRPELEQVVGRVSEAIEPPWTPEPEVVEALREAKWGPQPPNYDGRFQREVVEVLLRRLHDDHGLVLVDADELARLREAT